MMKSLRGFVLVAAAGLGVLALTQTSAQAQYRRPLPPRHIAGTPVVPVTPVYPVAPRVPVTVPSVQGYTNPYVLPGMTLNQLAAFDVLSMDPVLMMQMRLYNASRRPIVVAPTYPVYPYPLTYGTTGAYSPYNIYNPYFAAYGFHP